MATKYYIDNAGSAANNGTSTATPVDSFATLLSKGYTFANDDEFYFARHLTNPYYELNNGSAPTSIGQALLTIRPIIKSWAGLSGAPSGAVPKLVLRKAAATFYFSLTSGAGIYAEGVDFYWVVDGNTYSGVNTPGNLCHSTSCIASFFNCSFNFVKTGTSNKTVGHTYQVVNTSSVSTSIQTNYELCSFYDRNELEVYNVDDATWDNGYSKNISLGGSLSLISCYLCLQQFSSGALLNNMVSCAKSTIVYWVKWITANGYVINWSVAAANFSSFIGNTFINLEDLNTTTTNARYVIRYITSSPYSGLILNNVFASYRTASGGVNANTTLRAHGDGSSTTTDAILPIGGNIWIGHKPKEINYPVFITTDQEFSYSTSGSSSNYFSTYVQYNVNGMTYLNRAWQYFASLTVLAKRLIPGLYDSIVANTYGVINRSSTNPQVSAILNNYQWKGSDVWRPEFPAVADVKNATTYDFGQKTGTCVVPAANDVRNGTSVGSTTGSLIVPSPSDVRSGVGTDHTTGTLVTPADSDVRFGVGTGTLKVPAVTDVRNGVDVDHTVGSLDLPSINDVRASTSFDNGTKTGLLNIPTTANVRDGITYDNDTKTGSLKVPNPNNVRLGIDTDHTVGTLNVEAEANLPSETDVLTGSGNYGPNLDKVPSYSPDFPDRANVAPDDTVNGLSGTMDLPALDKVSPNDTLRGQTGTQDLPELSSIRADDTLEGVSGTLDLNKLPPSLGGTYLGQESNSVITASQIVSGQTVTNRGNTINGNQVIPSVSDVRSGTSVGTSTGSLTVPSVNDVRLGVSVDNTVGTLDVADEANLPNPANVLIGSGNYGPGLSITPTLSPDYPNPANVLENDSTNGTQGLVPLAKVAPSQGGSYLGEESNDDIPTNKVAIGYVYLNLGVSKTGEATTSTGSYAPASKVLDGVDRGDGVLGTFGRINTNPGMDISEQIAQNILNLIQTYLPNWVPADYIIDPEKNNFKGNLKRYGVLIGELNQDAQIIGQETLAREYTVRLITRYNEKGPNDKSQRSAGTELRTLMEELRRRGDETNWGNLTNIMDVRDYSEAEVQINENHGYAVCDLTLTVVYTIDKV